MPLFIVLALLFLFVRATPAAEPRLDIYGDPLPAGAINRFGSERYRPGLGANLTCMSADRTRLAAISSTNLFIYDAETGKTLQIGRAHV